MSHKIYVEHGGADTDEFWDVTFPQALLDKAGVETESTGISVAIDSVSGRVSLNEGYVADCPEGRDERLLWREYELLVVDALANEVKPGRGNDVFLANATKGSEMRRHMIRTQYEDVAEDA